MVTVPLATKLIGAGSASYTVVVSHSGASDSQVGVHRARQ